MKIPVRKIETYYDLWFFAGHIMFVDLDDIPF